MKLKHILEVDKGFEFLKNKIVDKTLCDGCGICAEVCDRIKISDGLPELVEPCLLDLGSTECGKRGLCVDNCPKWEERRGFELLKETIIDEGLCTGCAACAAFCERIELVDGVPTPVKDCIMLLDAVQCGEYGLCYDHCSARLPPRDELETRIFGCVREDELLGVYRNIFSAKAIDPEILKLCQDGGIVSSILAYGLENEIFEGVIVTRGTAGDRWKPEPVVLVTPEEIASAAGTIYSVSPSIMGLGEVIKNTELTKIAVVGTPCQMKATRNIQEHLFKKAEDIDITTIGVFCMENFEYSCLTNFIENELLAGSGQKFKDVTKTDITRGKFHAYTEKGDFDVEIKALDKCIKSSCLVCTDFASEFADVSVGSVGSSDGWSTVVIRSEKGEQLMNGMLEAGKIEQGDVKIDLVKKIATMKKEHAAKAAEAKEGGEE
ncbi:hypothetical protein B6V01_004475 [Methanosarcinales archaeon ex4572_44]|nr:MAG: hypothetical protein B6U67_01600 [Methanosarcinales archaeon ex4484_138]PHP45344.1 MAG: hypothetical protein B6V01_004475 [Methanosarcinales archaeon ex4572_44]RLG27275.1 MAG: hypothetical protein DRN85_00770 [Methanosarcinales archaeon]RLG28521.1 MAG: hypothetical protein DRN70_00415 [Methanosarcinales archaeon]